MGRWILASTLLALTLAGCRSETPAVDTTTPAAPTAPTLRIATGPTTTVGPTNSLAPATTSIPTTTATTLPAVVPASQLEIVAFPVPAGSRPHDVAPAEDGGVWYTGQGSGELGWLDPGSGEVRVIPLGAGSRPHGVIVGPDGAPWITDGGLNAIVRVDPDTDDVTVFPLPADRPDANLNTAAFAGDGRLWFTGQNGLHGVFDPETEEMEVFDSPGGRGPYGIDATPDGVVYYVSLAGSYLGRIDSGGSVTVIEPPTPDQGARRVWADSGGALWISEWNSGQLSRYEPDTGDWSEWPLPGDSPQAYAVYVDELDQVWVSDFGGNALHRFDPAAEVFDTFPLPSNPGNVRQILGRTGEVWGAESAADQLIVVRPAGS